MNLLFPRSGAVVLVALVVFVGVFGVGAALGANEAVAGNPTPMANDSMPPLQQEAVESVRSDVSGTPLIEPMAVSMAKTGASVGVVGMAVGHTSVGVLGEHLTRAWIESIPLVLVALNAIMTIHLVQKLRRISR